MASTTGSSSPMWQGMKLLAATLALSAVPLASAQSCVSLAGSTTCPAFNKSSISTTDATLLGNYPFLQYVTSREDFDKQLSSFVQQGYVQEKYQTLLGCSNVQLKNSSNYYARYTISTICNSIVQISIQPCGLTAKQAPPLCADTCAEQATSEEEIVNNPSLCGTPGDNYISQIRADFTYCALPADSLSGSCITGEQNEPDECGFSQNLQSLCSYCSASTPNGTDSCCVAANVEKRCASVTLPAVSSLPVLFTSTAAASASATASAAAASSGSNSGNGLSGGAIAGIVIGSIVGAALLAGLIILACICLKRRRNSSSHGSPFSQRSQNRADPLTDKSQPPPGGRVARMAALEGGGSSAGGTGLDPMLAAEKRRYGANSDSDPISGSPSARGPATSRRQGSLSSSSALGALGGATTTGDETTSPSNAGGQYSSPGDWHSGQSEQLPYFKDYYSSGEIHPHDRVSVLWAYQPRAADEFELERGDMLRVVGIWDDGWATGVRIPDRAEDVDGKHKEQRDSGISQAEGRKSPLEGGEVKAFPLVCVCLPEHWKQTIEGDGSTDSTSPPPPPQNPGPFGQF